METFTIHAEKSELHQFELLFFFFKPHVTIDKHLWQLIQVRQLIAVVTWVTNKSTHG